MRTAMTPGATGIDAFETHKRELLRGLTGTVLEIGAGDGANFAHFPAGIDWLGLEPGWRRRRRLARTAAAYGHHSDLIAAPAEAIPRDNASVDAVVSTITLCSVTDQRRALAEITRVLRPGGAFVFFEHIAAPAGSWSRRLQRSLGLVSRGFGGCDPGRDTGHAIDAAGFRGVHTRSYAGPRTFGIHTPLLGGIAYT